MLTLKTGGISCVSDVLRSTECDHAMSVSSRLLSNARLSISPKVSHSTCE